MKIRDIASILNLDANELREDINSQGSPAHNAYFGGKNATKMILHDQEYQLAKVGSPLALENFRLYLLDMEDDE